MERSKGEVFELPLDLLNTKAVRQGRIDVHGLLSGAALFPLLETPQGPHVVETISQFDEQHSPVGRHRNEHLANRGGLLSLFGIKVQSIKLRHAIDNCRNRGSKISLEIPQGDQGVFNGVMEQSGRNGRRIKT